MATVGERTRARVAIGAGVLALLLALTGLVVGPAARAKADAPAFVDTSGPHGVHVVGVTQIDSRQYNVSVLSPALGRAVDVRILLPVSYAQNLTARYPTLYLFHGTSGRASDWVNTGDAVATLAPYDVITVMPDAGFNGDGGGWFTNWVDTTTQKGPAQWETFHIADLIPWVDANLRTIAARNGRAVAGLSQGGFGSTTYAARHPDTFVATASFSGAPEIDRDPDVIIGATAVIEATATGLNQTQPEAMFGSRVTNEINWQGHDPATLITNLRGTGIYLWTANGFPGPYDTGAPNFAASGIEYMTHVSTQHFHDHLGEAGIPSYYNDYGNGTHIWPYWARDLREFAPMMMNAFANPPAPSAVDYKSIDKTWTQWGWTVALNRTAAQQFSQLSNGGRGGFTLQGNGTATVTTPGVYTPGAPATVHINGPAGATVTTVTADAGGHLAINVGLDTSPIPGLPAVRPGTATVTIDAS